MIQTADDLEKWYKKKDPWGYEDSPEDIKRKSILLSEIPKRKYKNVLDIGCGQGFITRDLPGKKITGVDISKKAIKQAQAYANKRVKFKQASIFKLTKIFKEKFDLILITGVLYPQYIGNSHNLVYSIIDKLLADSGILITVHIDSWYKAKFPYLQLVEYFYNYREFTHRLEVYIK